jgi:hypothetical protein
VLQVWQGRTPWLMSVGVRLWFASTVESQSYQYPMSGIEESESGWEGVFLEWVGARFSR